MVDLKQKLSSPLLIGGQQFSNPIWLASGTAAFGEELARLIPLNQCGAIVLKGCYLHPREGNPTPRLVETPAGLLNAIGLQSPGISALIKEKLPPLQALGVPVVLNIAGKDAQEYETIAKIIADEANVQGIEVNMSCPNVEKGLDNGTNPAWIEDVIQRVKAVSNAPVIAKLTPNCTDIVSLAKAAQAGGADAVSLINTLLGMAFDLRTQQPILANKMGGLSGPAIRPVAIRMVYQVAQAVRIPIVGIGGIMNLDDIYEFFIAGASAVQLGTLSFVDLNEVKSILQLANANR